MLERAVVRCFRKSNEKWEGAAYVNFRIERNVSSHKLAQLLADRQAKSGTSVLGSNRCISLRKRGKQFGLIFLCYPYARVTYAEMKLLCPRIYIT